MQKVYLLLPVDDCQGFDKVKAELKSWYWEAYCQFHKLRKQEHPSYMEFALEKEALFDRWCKATEAGNFEQLKQLVLKFCLSVTRLRLV